MRRRKSDRKDSRLKWIVCGLTDGCARAFLSGEHLGIYHVGTEDEVTIAAVATKVAAAFGREVELKSTPAPAGATSRRCPNTAKVRSLGVVPKVSLDEGIQKTVNWYAKQ